MQAALSFNHTEWGSTAGRPAVCMGIKMDKEIKLSIQLTTPDMFRFMLRHTYTSFSGLFGVAISIGALVLLAAGFKDNDAMTNLVLAAIGALFLIVNPLMLWFKASQQIKRSPVFKKPLVYDFKEDGVIVSQDDQELEIKWEDIRKVIETGSLVVVYLSSVRAYVLPKNQYKDDYAALKSLFNSKVSDKVCRWKKVQG